jgi:hypothetical protein
MYRLIDCSAVLLPIGKAGSITSNLQRSCGSRMEKRRGMISWLHDVIEGTCTVTFFSVTS